LISLLLLLPLRGLGYLCRGIQSLHASSFMTLALSCSAASDLRKRIASLWSPADGPCNARHGMQE
jgi:hypothetical protein